jgi:hypothetical protein
VAATLAELDNITGDDLMCHWQFIKAVLEHRYGDLSKEEAIETMAFYSGLEPFFCEIMLKELRKERLVTLMVSFPKIGPCPRFEPPRYHLNPKT